MEEFNASNTYKFGNFLKDVIHHTSDEKKKKNRIRIRRLDDENQEEVTDQDTPGIEDPNAEVPTNNELGGEQQETPEKQEWDDPNRQGAIRSVEDAHLVFKRQNDEGTFEELWLYKDGDDFKSEIDIKRNIMAGTDIPKNQSHTNDKSQESKLWSVGNIQMLHIWGLPN